MSGDRVTRLTRGDSPFKGPLSTKQWNKVADAATMVHAMSVTGMMGGGVAATARGGRPMRAVMGIVDAGEATDYTDNRYFVRVHSDKLSPARAGIDSDDQAIVTATGNTSFQFVATNLAEMDPASPASPGSHLLPNGSAVLLWQLQFVTGENQWFFWHPVVREFWAEITGSTARAHTFKERRHKRGDTDEFEDVPDGKTGTAYEVNWREGVPSGTQVLVHVLWDYSQSSPRYWFDIGAGDDQEDGADANRTDITYAGEHTEAAISDTGWDVEDQGTERGLKLSVITGVAYYDAGDETLYAYKRDLEFDANGHLMRASTESRVAIEVPEAC